MLTATGLNRVARVDLRRVDRAVHSGSGWWPSRLGREPSQAPPSRALSTTLGAALRPSVIWLAFQHCTGCSESLLRSTHPTVNSLILDMISLDYHETLMAGSGRGSWFMPEKDDEVLVAFEFFDLLREHNPLLA